VAGFPNGIVFVDRQLCKQINLGAFSMKRFVLFALLACLTICGNRAAGHGFGVQLIGNKIVADSGSNTVNGIDQLFVETIVGSPTFYFASDGGIGGMNAGNGFPAGSSLRVDFNGPLWYSAGSGAAPANPDILMQPYKVFGSPLVDIDGASGPQAGFPIGGTSSHEFTWSLLIKPAATLTEIPPGVYGWSFTVSGTGPGGPFEPSLPLVIAFATDGFTGSQLEPAYLDVFNAAVPEPAACGLAAMGLGALFFARKRLRRKAA